MKKRLTAFFCCLLVLFSIVTAAPVSAQGDMPDDIDRLLEDITAFSLSGCGARDRQQWIDSWLTENAGTMSETYILALHQSGRIYDYSSYSRSLMEFIEQKETAGAVTRQKYALALMAANCRSEYITQTAESTIGQLGIMSWIFGLHLLSNGAECRTCTAQDAVVFLLNARLPDGGWAVSGDVSDVDVTAMAIQALAPYAHEPEVASALSGALDFLSQQQLHSGAFSSYGIECTESTAQVIIALCALDIDCRADQRFIKDGRTALDGMLLFRLEDGSYSHSHDKAYSHMATSQAFAALTAMQRQRDGLGSLYLLDPQPAGTVEPLPSDPEPAAQSGWRTWACLVIAALALGGCAALYFTGRRSPKNFAVIAAAAAAAVILVFALDIQSPDDYYGSAPEKGEVIGTVTLTIRCDTIAGTSDSPHIPADGIILAPVQMPLAQGDTVYDILTDAAREHSIHIETEGAAGTEYVSGIGHIYEFEHGELSGWIYRVNGRQASVGCSSFVPEDGDTVEWLYSCRMGKDLD